MVAAVGSGLRFGSMECCDLVTSTTPFTLGVFEYGTY